MNRIFLILSAAVAVLVVISAAVIPMIQIGQATRAATDSTEDLQSQYIFATTAGGSVIGVPPVTYVWDGTEECSKPGTASASVSGQLEIGVVSVSDDDLSVLVSFKNVQSWMLIKTLTLTIGQIAHVLYDSDGKTGVAGDWVDLGEITTGKYSFTIDVVYKEQIKLEPSSLEAFSDMESNIIFMLGDNSSIRTTGAGDEAGS